MPEDNKRSHCTNITRTDILESIKMLDKIKRYYRGIQQQRTAFFQIVNHLRKAYRCSPKLFSRLDIKMIQHLIEYVKNYEGGLLFNKEVLHQGSKHGLAKGTVVLHKTDYYVGVIVDSREMLDDKTPQDQNIDKEYRIFISAQEVRFAPSFDLLIIGSSVISYCFKCHGLISIFSKKCNKCHWRICPNCKSCNCNYNTCYKAETKPLGARIAKKTQGQQIISQCVNCQKFGTEFCTGPSNSTGSHNRVLTFCPAYSPRHRNP